MIKRFIYFVLALGILTALSSDQVHAVSTSLVITQAQAGGLSGDRPATQEFVSVYNNTDQVIDVTNWCLRNKADVSFACLTPQSANQKFYLPSYSYFVAVSDTFMATMVDYHADIIFATTNNTSGSITGGSDTLRLVDAGGVEIDAVGWTSTLSGGQVMQRSSSSVNLGSYLDTDLPADFTKSSTAALPASGVYEEITIIDVCANLEGAQESVPSGYLYDTEDNCVELSPVDSCVNLEGIQPILPEGYLVDANGDCQFDLCDNLEGLQLSLPLHYVRSDGNDCQFDLVALQLTEVLPNVEGSDADSEYIELYNPSARVVALVDYQLSIGSTTLKVYQLPLGAVIEPFSYYAVYNHQINFTLPNTTGQVQLTDSSGTLIDQISPYTTPKEDTAWVLINGVWQYSNRPTPGVQNLAMLVEEKVVTVSNALQACAANQFRHPDTNRCRLIATSTTTLTPCKDGQYRSEATNRCRSIAVTTRTLVPCRDDQYRSEETNRCRNVTTASASLTPCRDDQYRSELTNRCRNRVTETVPVAAYAVEPIVETDKAFIGWWVLWGVGAAAIGYAGWEWRGELGSGLRKIRSFFTSGK